MGVFRDGEEAALGLPDLDDRRDWQIAGAVAGREAILAKVFIEGAEANDVLGAAGQECVRP